MLDQLLLFGSIGLSVLSVAEGVNKAYELCVGDEMEPPVLPKVVLLAFRCCDVFSRLAFWALLGFCLRPTDAKLRPYLPIIMAAESLLIAALFKSRSFGLNLTWSDLFQKQHFVSVMGCILGTYWCCTGTILVAQHRLFKSLSTLRFLQTLGVLWLCALVYSASVGGECLVTEKPAIVMITLLAVVSYGLTLIMAFLHDLSMSFFALPLFPVRAGWLGGRLELAARFGVAWKIPRVLQSAKAEEAAAALCQAAEAGHVSVIHALLDARVSVHAAASSRDASGRTALLLAAQGGHVAAIKALQSHGLRHMEQADSDGWTPVLFAARNGHLDVVKFLQSSGCNMDRANNDQCTSVVLAAEFGHLDVVKFLQSSGCNMEKADKDGRTAVVVAATSGHLNVVKFLHGCGCHITAHSVIGAFDKGHSDVVQFLSDFVDVKTAGFFSRLEVKHILAMAHGPGPVTEAEALFKAGHHRRPRLVGLTALEALTPPEHGHVWFTCGTPDLAQSAGKFYHEIQLLSEFYNPQLGWLSTDGRHDGVGDDSNGWAFDGHIGCWWHNGCRKPVQMSRWKVNDVLGFAIDLDKGQMQLRTDQEEHTMFFQVPDSCCKV